MKKNNYYEVIELSESSLKKSPEEKPKSDTKSEKKQQLSKKIKN